MLGCYQILRVPPWVTGWSDFCPWKSLLSPVNLEQKCAQVSDLLSVVSSLTVQVKFLMAFPKPSVFERIYKEFAVALLAFVVLVSNSVWKRETWFFSHYTCTGEVHSVSSNVEVFPITCFSAFYSVMKGQIKRLHKSSTCFPVIDFKVSPWSQGALKNIAWKVCQSLGL